MEPGVILAGGLSPNGRAAVLALLTAGFRPVVFDYPFDASSATGAQHNPESGSDLPCSVLTVDLLCGDSIAEALDRAISQVGEIRALVFCDTWTGKTGTKQECLDYIREVWTDMRPASLRRQMEQSSDV